MAKKETRTLEAYSIHGRGRDGVIDYADLLERIVSIPLRDRQAQIGDQIVAVTYTSTRDSLVVMRFVAGRAGEPAHFYDTNTGQEIDEDIGSRIVANSALVSIDTSKRIAAIERRRPGVSVAAIESLLSELGGRLSGGQVRIDLNPIAAPSLRIEIEQLERIREAAIVLKRPNYDWNDNAAELSGYADDSGAAIVEILLKAPRGDSLKKATGILSDIKDFIAHPISGLRDLRVVGQMPGEDKERTIRLGGHKVRKFVPIHSGDNERESLEEASKELINSIPLASDTSEALIDSDR